MTRTAILWLAGSFMVVLLSLWGASLYVEIQKNRAIHTVEHRVQVIERFIGPQGEKGKAGKPGKPGKSAQPIPLETLRQVVAQAVREQLHTGPAGKNGTNGSNGKVGPRGPRGPSGANGKKGEAGLQGPQGATGATGATGIPGPICPAGFVGQTLVIQLKLTDKP